MDKKKHSGFEYSSIFRVDRQCPPRSVWILLQGHLGCQDPGTRMCVILEYQQDHQRWGYSTVTHMEQSVNLAIWKDLNKKKRKGQRKKIEL